MTKHKTAALSESIEGRAHRSEKAITYKPYPIRFLLGEMMTGEELPENMGDVEITGDPRIWVWLGDEVVEFTEPERVKELEAKLIEVADFLSNASGRHNCVDFFNGVDTQCAACSMAVSIEMVLMNTLKE